MPRLVPEPVLDQLVVDAVVDEGLFSLIWNNGFQPMPCQDLRIEVTLHRFAHPKDGAYYIEFPKHQRTTTVARAWVAGKLTKVADAVGATQALRKEAELQPQLVQGIRAAADALPDVESLKASQLQAAITAVDALIPVEPAETSIIVPMVRQLSSELGDELRVLTTPPPGDVEGVTDAVVNAMPPFVYYSNYGNL